MEENKINSKRKNVWKDSKILQAFVLAGPLLFGIASLAIVAWVEIKFVQDWWAVGYAACSGIAAFLLLIPNYMDFPLVASRFGFAFSYLALLTVTTSLFGSGIWGHLFGGIIGVIIFCVGILFMTDEWDYTVGFAKVCIGGIIMVALTNSIYFSNDKFDAALEKAEYKDVKKIFVENADGSTHYIVLTDKDTLDLCCTTYPQARFLSENSQVKYVLDNKKVVRFAVKD